MPELAAVLQARLAPGFIGVNSAAAGAITGVAGDRAGSNPFTPRRRRRRANGPLRPACLGCLTEGLNHQLDTLLQQLAVAAPCATIHLAPEISMKMDQIEPLEPQHASVDGRDGCLGH